MDTPGYTTVRMPVQETNVIELLVCEQCGALVFAPLNHKHWHRQLRIDLDAR